MRTRLVVDDALFRAVKKRAEAQGSTVSEVVDDALRQLFARPTAHERRDAKLRSWGRPKARRRAAQ
jgi:Arc/MetJ family transcription regulator